MNEKGFAVVISDQKLSTTFSEKLRQLGFKIVSIESIFATQCESAYIAKKMHEVIGVFAGSIHIFFLNAAGMDSEYAFERITTSIAIFRKKLTPQQRKKVTFTLCDDDPLAMVGSFSQMGVLLLAPPQGAGRSGCCGGERSEEEKDHECQCPGGGGTK
ncbi:hypothetical protein KKH43_00165 [Patescibacteria group bacterium]|nr:hypothetical protein [Patescibacteria group bacterium]